MTSRPVWVPRPTDVNRVLREREGELRALVPGLELDLAGDLPPAWTDPSDLGEALVALVGAAVAAGSTEASIATAISDANAPAPSDHPRTVDIVVRIDRPIAAPPTDVRDVVSRNLGSVEAGSAQEPATRWTVRLLAFPDLLDPPLSVDAPAPVHHRFGEIGPTCKTILLVEDDPSVRELLSAALKRSGHRVVTAPDGVAALRALLLEERSGHPVGLMVTDVVMPGMSGYALAEHAAAIMPGVDVVFISGYRDIAVPPGKVLLHKPFSPEAFHRLVTERLQAS